MNFKPCIFEVGNYIQIGSLIVHPFISSHDAVDSSNFIINAKERESKKLAIATDLGYAHNLLKNYLKQATTIILESNHDVEMLRTGPYEWYLKQRILSKTGHLSNEQATELIKDIINDRHERLILTHLSEINNTPEIAFAQMKEMLTRIKAKIDLHIASQYECTPLFNV
jgi:phosphoribosyl 1,2-cyclic phosphodiesterase